MQKSELVAAVLNKVQDPSWSKTEVLSILNRGIAEIAGGGSRNFGLPLLGPIPCFMTSGTVSTSTAAYVTLPTNFGRDVFRVTDSSGNDIKIYDSFRKFFDDWPGLSTAGSVQACCVVGSKLYFQGIPASPVTLTVWYYRKPTSMSADSDEPDGIPSHLQYRLLVSYACMDIFSQIEDGIEGAKRNTDYFTNEYQLALTDMHRYIGTSDKDPMFIREDADFLTEDW